MGNDVVRRDVHWVFWPIAGIAIGGGSLGLYWLNLQLLVGSGDLSLSGVAAYLFESAVAMSLVGFIHHLLVRSRAR